ncbi:glycosyltransferase family 2 protein [Streptomyces europaeiscabiei]|uniref:Glycosyltransferase family 2 protein n=4 Tax=Streptomyces europaeiscabiei TaxID=146819 RepID=A0ABU4NB13_9ACTN|nr:glycosyltransferase family 2 protein [Streptomyces europaeiscabiei]MDX3541690.1 glycosyltransferase family 2 protein [Streptomyces europaeiscabiei]MDX3552031.1 glycosyltransferase family 2 protein [Streptomyces europaeiscabiei]MDX3669293.1 glycosyltransferase family 2 protein [Streptomyces europaeiscabiei]MDX3700270.1 glycosyltransferase family 2 protein [Streptomyces europaeiscabiei]MDX3711398.1 glycosyltransferase family 2 protein [Streptomyces europaeiscabiei]
MALQQAQVSVVVIGYDDAAHVADAVRSALAQGPSVREVIAVDDCSTDGSGELLERLAEEEPRLRVLRRRSNSGGCGTPRNDGLDAATAPYVMFLDSDDTLPPGAVDVLLDAALEYDAPVASGLCVRRELPSGRETPWQPELYARRTLVQHPSQRVRLVHDTLCVNKLYRTSFLRDRAIRFPEGRFPYEDFVFGARVLAAVPRVALVPEPVYVWNVRRSAARLSISLDRSGIANWRARTEADRLSYDILLGAGEKQLARATRTRFLDHSLRMYARELDLRGTEYRREWWALTRAHLASFDEGDFASAPAPGRVVARVILAAEEPRDLARLKEVAARPARLAPPYARAGDGSPVWSADLPQVELDHLLVRPVHLLPAAVDAELRPRARGTVLRLRLHELYGRMAEAGPESVEVEFSEREDGRVGFTGSASLVAETDFDSWTAEVPLDLAALGSGTWDLRLRLRFADGGHRETTAHALAGAGLLRRSALPSTRHGVLLAQPYATHAGALAIRLAPGWRGLTDVVRRRLKRLLH